MKKTDKKGEKPNSRIYGTVKAGARRVKSAVRGFFRKLKIWQKAVLAVCIVFWILSYVISLVCGRITGKMLDQTYASRWDSDNKSAQVSAFFSESTLASTESVEGIRARLNSKLMEDSFGLSEKQIENGASMMNDCYCGIGSADVSTPSDSVSVTAIGVGGDFFNFHPLDLMSGFYFSEDESMKDRILLDDKTAWRLFGSPYIVGESVDIGGTPHYIAGVFRTPTKRFYRQSGMGDYLVYISYDSLCRYTEAGVSSDGEGIDGTDGAMMDAFAPVKGNKTIYNSSNSFTLTENMTLPAGAVPDAAIDENFALVKSVALPPAVSGTMWKPDPAEVSFTESAVGVTDGIFSRGQQRASGGEDTGALPRTEQGDRLLAFESVDELNADSGEETGEEGTEEEGTEETGDTGTEPEEDDDDRITNDDAPIGGTMSGGDDYWSSGGDEGETAEINRDRISCYEAVMPNPIETYAVTALNDALTNAEVNISETVVVENTGRFDSWRLALMMAQPGLRSMQAMAMRYPYWENVALAWEDVLIPFSFLELFMRFSPFLLLLFLVLWYATHRSWTVGGGIQKLRNRLYDRQSEKLYGKSPDDQPVLTDQSADNPGEGISDNNPEAEESPVLPAGTSSEGEQESGSAEENPAERTSPEDSSEEGQSAEKAPAGKNVSK